MLAQSRSLHLPRQRRFVGYCQPACCVSALKLIGREGSWSHLKGGRLAGIFDAAIGHQRCVCTARADPPAGDRALPVAMPALCNGAEAHRQMAAPESPNGVKSCRSLGYKNYVEKQTIFQYKHTGKALW
jgi:hypothetical protein